MLNSLLYTCILYQILFLLICDAFMCVHCIVFYSSASEALINNNNNNNNISIVCKTETWFKAYIGYESVSLYGFNLEKKDRKNGRAGGVACYVRNDVLYKRLDSSRTRVYLD